MLLILSNIPQLSLLTKQILDNRWPMPYTGFTEKAKVTEKNVELFHQQSLWLLS